jgi:hypothetical protein
VVAAPLTSTSTRRRPRFLGTVVAALLALGLGAYIYFVELKRDPEAKADKEKVLTFPREAVSEVHIQRAGGDVVRVVREGQAWKIVEPLAADADPGEVDGILGTLEGLVVDEVVESAGPLADFGLEPAARTLRLKLKGGATHELAVGSKTPDGASVYVRRGSEPRVFTLPSYVEGMVDKKAFDLRDRRLLRVSREAIRSLRVSGPQSFALEKVGESWRITAPLATPAGRWPVDSLVGVLEALRFDAIVSESPTLAELKTLGLDPPAWTVEVGVQDAPGQRLHLGARTADGKVNARIEGRPLLVTVAPALADDLAKGMNELRAKRLLEVSTYEVVKVELATPAGARTLLRSAIVDPEGVPIYKWKRQEGQDVPTKTVEDALFLLGGVEATAFVDQPGPLATYGLDAPALKATLSSEGKPAAWFELAIRDGKAYARRVDDGAILEIAPDKAKELQDAFGKM